MDGMILKNYFGIDKKYLGGSKKYHLQNKNK